MIKFIIEPDEQILDVVNPEREVTLNKYSLDDAWYPVLTENTSGINLNEWAVYLINPSDGSTVYWLKYSDFNGAVNFGVETHAITFRQLIDEYSYTDGTIHIRITDAGGGEGPFFKYIGDSLIYAYEFIKSDPILTQILLNITFSGIQNFSKLIKNQYILKKYEHADSVDFVEYIYQQKYWTLEELKTKFGHTDENSIIQVMNLLFFSYNEETQLFKGSGKVKFFSNKPIPMHIPDFFKILLYHIEELEYNSKVPEWSLVNLRNMLETDISLYDLREILDQMMISVTKDDIVPGAN